MVTDADGVERLDFINTMTTMILGHGPAPVLEAARQQMELGLAYNSPNRHQVELARLLCERIPSFQQVRFTNSGTEATLNTLRAARAFTGRSKFAKVEGGYHGTHDAVLVSLRIDPATGGDYDNPQPVPVQRRSGRRHVLDQAVIIPYNDVETARNGSWKRQRDESGRSNRRAGDGVSRDAARRNGLPGDAARISPTTAGRCSSSTRSSASAWLPAARRNTTVLRRT